MKKFCFVVMPFGFGQEYEGGREESDFIYNDIIKPAVDNAVQEFQSRYGDTIEHELDVVRELENVAPGAITESIVRRIAEAILPLSTSLVGIQTYFLNWECASPCGGTVQFWLFGLFRVVEIMYYQIVMST